MNRGFQNPTILVGFWKARKGPRKFQFLFDATGLTRYGGLLLFRQFCKSLNLRYFLQHHVRWPPYHHRSYHPADLFLAHLFALVAGIGRIESTQSLVHNGLIAAHDRLRAALFQRLGLLYSAVVDADTTALLTYGHQEGTAVGYIPKRRHGKPSYAPLLSSEGRSGLSLGAELRAGNVHSSTGAWAFLKPILDKLPSTIAASRTRVRLDGAFYDREIVEPLEGDPIGYVIVARMTQPLKREMVSARYHEFTHGWEAAEFPYTPFRWKDEHRFVAVRRPAALEPEDIQQCLFTFKRYTYHRAVVTNLDLTPEAIYKRGNRNYLRLPARYPQQELFRKIQTATAGVQPVI